jgi:monofunctional biosynthetic peptidoglycan transglycosylase
MASLRWLAVAASAGFVLLAAVQAWYYAHVLWWKTHDPALTAFMQARLERMREKHPAAVLRHRWVPYSRIAQSLKRAVIAAEDAKFVGHEGFDWEAIQSAIERNEARGRVVAGASTISQQLAKNLFLSPQRSWWRKGQEAAITLMLESTLSKRRILEMYLNVAEWGDGVFGAEAAARHHFGIAAAELSAEQAAWLAAVLPSPLRYERGRTTLYLQGRVQTILARMQVSKIP